MDSNSEEDEPVNISFKSAKVSAQDEIEKIRLSVNMKKERILSRRRQHEELLREQKRTSTSKKKLSEPEETIVLKPEEAQSAELESRKSKRKKSTRDFPSIGISVQSLNSVSNSRGASLIDFKSKRLAKAHREPIRNIISYQEKLAAKNK